MIRCLLLLMLLSTLSAQALEPPEVFERIDFSAASARAKQEGRWLLVDATASWCEPCRKMDATTWVDPAVKAFMAAHLVAIQVDVDEQKELAKRLEITAMPTIIVIGPEGEIDRLIGYRTAAEFLAWMDDVKNGITELDRLRQEAQSGDLEDRYALAEYLMKVGKWEQAEELLLDLWMATEEEGWRGVRHSYLVSDLGRLAKARPSAQARLEAFRSEALSKGNLRDWFFLSKELGHDQELMTWQPDRPLSSWLESSYFDYLIEHQALAKAGNLISDPINVVSEILANRERILSSPDDEIRQDLSEYAITRARGRLLKLYEACLAAGRLDEARAVRGLALHDDPTLETAFDELDAQWGEVAP